MNILFFLFLVLTFPVFGQYTTKEARDSFMRELAERYCTDAKAILFHDSVTYITYFTQDSTRDKLIEHFSTGVHEACHKVNYSIFDPYGYFISQDILIEAKRTEVFDNKELVNFMPDSLVKCISRFNTYIAKGNPGGIYSLLNEYSAYFHGNLAEIELKKNGIWIQNPQWYIKNGGLNSYYDFRVFISSYLEYAQQAHPRMYDEIMANLHLRAAFTLLDDRFTQLIREVRTSKDLVRGYSFYSENCLRPVDEKMLETFRINGLTAENYKDFLK